MSGNSVALRWVFVGLLLIVLSIALAACGEETKQQTDEAGQEIEEAADEAADVPGAMGDDAGEAAEEAGDDIEEAADEAGEELDEAADETGEALDDAGEEVEDAADETGEALDEAADETGEALDDAGEEVEEAADETGEAVDEAADETGEQIEEAGDEIQEQGEDVAEDVEDASDAASDELDQAGEELDQAGENVEEAGENVGEAVDQTGEAVEEAAEEVAPEVDVPDADEVAEETGEQIEEAGDEIEEQTDELAEDLDDVDFDLIDADLDLSLPDQPLPIIINDQFLGDEGQITVTSVTTETPAWVVVHANDDGLPGDVLGYTRVEAGTNENVVINIEDADDTSGPYWVMLHEDTGAENEFEFGSVDDTDMPIAMGGTMTAIPFWTGEHIRVRPQMLLNSTNLPEGVQATAAQPTLTVSSVLSEGPGWVVAYAAEGDEPGQVIGYAAVADGINNNVEIPVQDPTMLTPAIYLALHDDTGVEGEFEFGSVDDTDMPLSVDDETVQYRVSVAPDVSSKAWFTSENTLIVNWALIDVPGWLVVHADDGSGNPGEVLGYTALNPGLNTNISVEINPANVTDTLHVMLHYDTGTVGTFEFGETEGQDIAVQMQDQVVVTSLDPAEIDE